MSKDIESRIVEYFPHEIRAAVYRINGGEPSERWSALVNVNLRGGLNLSLGSPSFRAVEDARRYSDRLVEVAKVILDRVNFAAWTGFEQYGPVETILADLPKVNGDLAQWCGWRDDDLCDGKSVVHALCDDGSPWCAQGKPLDTGDGKCHTTWGNLNGKLAQVTCPVCRLHFEV